MSVIQFEIVVELCLGEVIEVHRSGSVISICDCIVGQCWKGSNRWYYRVALELGIQPTCLPVPSWPLLVM